MNAAQDHNKPLGESTGSLNPSAALSALVDGELGESEWNRFLSSRDEGSDTLATWHAYQVIGDVLRRQVAATCVQPAPDFLAAVRLGMQAKTSEPQALVVAAGPRRGDAANDAVFRWKMVAGFASLAAVMAVSWSVLVGSSGEPGGANAIGSQLVNNMPAQPAAVVAAQVVPAAAPPLVVSTGQGNVIRDAQLEALLAEHRQNGGMSALQMPTGFIRNATYDASGR